MEMIRCAHSAAGITSGYFRYNLSNVRAAFFFTKLGDVLRNALDVDRASGGARHERGNEEPVNRRGKRFRHLVTSYICYSM